ncbi:MAG: homocysteine S-methyltransferase family protein [Hydrotalea sp.]|nr:homocysteine S-methyltransferase family protein [Hydrotalea sp.]
MTPLHDAIKNNSKGFLLLDGAMGTNLFVRGLLSGDEPALWNRDQPEKIQSVHEEFIDNGADIVLTNSFGANPYRLKLHKAESQVAELNRLAVENVKTAIEKKSGGRRVFIGGDIGPSGELLMPLGLLTHDDAMAGFGEQIVALDKSGADFIWVETMSAVEEVAAIVAAADKNIGKKNIVVTMTFDTNGKTMMGISPEKAVEDLLKMSGNIVACGINCGKSPAESVYSLWQWQRHLAGMNMANPPLMVAKANRGVPQYVVNKTDGKGTFEFDGTAEMMRDYGRLAYALGARLIGGCCGTDGPTLRAIEEGATAEAAAPQFPDRAEITPDIIQKILGPVPENTIKHSHN